MINNFNKFTCNCGRRKYRKESLNKYENNNLFDFVEK